MNTNTNFISTLKAVMEDKVSEIESKLGTMIESKLNERLPGTDSNLLLADKDHSYAQKFLKVPEEVRKIIEESKNSEKVEENEQERHSKNFIIHRAEEFGNTPERIKKLDHDYVLDILKHIGKSQTPESVVRLGNPKPSKMRPIKVQMKTKDDKINVMKYLKKLKGTVDEFGKISERKTKKVEQ